MSVIYVYSNIYVSYAFLVYTHEQLALHNRFLTEVGKERRLVNPVLDAVWLFSLALSLGCNWILYALQSIY